MSRSREAPSPMLVPQSGRVDDGQRSFTWKPALQKIKRGLFSSKEVEQCGSIQPVEPFPPPEYDVVVATGLPQDQTSTLTIRGSILQKHQTGLNGASQLRERPRGPREPHDLKGFNLIKRTLSKSKKSSPPSSYAATNSAGIPREDTIAPGIQMPNYQLHTQRRTARENDAPEVMRPRIAGYVPRHAGKEVAASIQQTRPLQPPANLSKHTTSYTPKHAASDFSRMNMMPAIDAVQANRFAHARIQFERPATVALPPREPQLDSSDYQKFLAESRKSTDRTGRSRMEKQTPSEISNVTDDIKARHHAHVRERTLSISQLSTTSRTGRPPSFVEKLGEYIKPTRPVSVYSQRKFFEGDDKSSMKGSVETGQERWEMRWARVGSSIRRSFSRERDRKDDTMTERERAPAPEIENTGRRNRIMPVSRGLMRYNRVIAGY